MLATTHAPQAPAPHAPPRRATSAAAVERVVNDVHSRLNATRVARVERPRSTEDVVVALERARRDGLEASACGGRHAMGGQQFRAGGVLIDMRGMDRVLAVDRHRGLAVIEAGAQWPGIVEGLLRLQAGDERAWSIIQKQTGADRLTLGGAAAANIHGRLLGRPPFAADVEEITLVDPRGDVRRCSRTENRGLFRLALGGYGLFGIVTTVTLKLARRRPLERVVERIGVEDLPAAFEERRSSGHEQGDFQFAVDAASPAFLRDGVFSCYRPAAPGVRPGADNAELAASDWRDLVMLAHVDPTRAFERYAAHYSSTSGQVYWSDALQLATYLDHYHAEVDARLGHPGSEVITELIVPRERLVALMLSVRTTLRRCGVPLVYGTVRLAGRDDDTDLPWARWPAACVVLNLHVAHARAARARAAAAFRALIDDALAQGGTYYLTYHRHATRTQAEAAHPSLRRFLELQREWDPEGRLASDWLRHHRRLLGLAT